MRAAPWGPQRQCAQSRRRCTRAGIGPPRKPRGTGQCPGGACSGSALPCSPPRASRCSRSAPAVPERVSCCLGATGHYGDAPAADSALPTPKAWCAVALASPRNISKIREAMGRVHTLAQNLICMLTCVCPRDAHERSAACLLGGCLRRQAPEAVAPGGQPQRAAVAAAAEHGRGRRARQAQQRLRAGWALQRAHAHVPGKPCRNPNMTRTVPGTGNTRAKGTLAPVLPLLSIVHHSSFIVIVYYSAWPRSSRAAGAAAPPAGPCSVLTRTPPGSPALTSILQVR